MVSAVLDHGGSTRRLAPYALAAGAFGVYTARSLQLHRSFRSNGLDLGIFEQIVRCYAQGRWPVADLIGPGHPALGDHFHPILALLAPFYALFPRPETLLVAQAALLALSTVPVTRLAVRTTGNRVGIRIGVGYALSWGLLGAVEFDFHEICFAVPLVAFAVERLALHEWGHAVACGLPLVLVKEDQALTVAGIGLYLLWHRERRLGLAVTAFGVASLVLLTAVVIPAISIHGEYEQMRSLSAPMAAPVFAGLGTKLVTVIALLLPTAFLAARSPLLLLVLPTLAWRFASGKPSHWGIYAHYSAVLMPIVFVAFVDALTRVRATPRIAAAASLAATGMMTAFLLARPPTMPSWSARQQADAERVLAQVPDGQIVAASNRLAPHLTGRCRVLLYPRDATPQTTWLAVDKQTDALPSHGYTVVASFPHLALLRRG